MAESVAALAALVQDLVDKVARFKNEQVNLYTSSGSMVTVTGADGTPVSVPSWAAVQAASGYDINVFERATLGPGAVITRNWPNQQLAAPTSAQDWYFTSAAGDTALVHLLRVRKGSAQKDLLASVVISGGVGELTLNPHSLGYAEGLEFMVQTGSVTGFTGTLRYLYLV